MTAAVTLGDTRAESDQQMLDSAFLETAEYHTLLENTRKTIVVGRRGTGKSALAYRLEKYWANEQHSKLIFIAPDEAQVIGLRPMLELFGNDYRRIKAGLKIAWPYLIAMECVSTLSRLPQIQKNLDCKTLLKSHERFYSAGRNIAQNLRTLLLHTHRKDERPECLIADLAERIGFGLLKEHLQHGLRDFKGRIYVIVDRLDEGYEPDTIGIAMVAGILEGTHALQTALPILRPLIFVRDNIFRAVAATDDDYSRNIEGLFVRLHWSEHTLLNFVAKRIRLALKLDEENDYRIWNRIAARTLSGPQGFRKCLKLTLYRPRDLLSLLNETFLIAAQSGRKEIVEEDIAASAKEISRTRLADLQKEYKTVFPALEPLSSAFTGAKSELTTEEVADIVRAVVANSALSATVKQDLALLDTPQIIKSLYGVGFVGKRDKASDGLTFCHDGRESDFSPNANDLFVVHPCYQPALGITREGSAELQFEEIHDDYRISISSISQEERNKRVGQIVTRIRSIGLGHEGSTAFEDWCFESVSTVFAGALRDIELHPNPNSVASRDIVALNTEETPFWKRVRTDYESRHVLFEVKNYAELTPSDFRQSLDYLSEGYGRLGFVITRSEVKEPQRDKELVWIREKYNKHRKLIIPLSYKWLTTFLEKIRNPQKHRAVDAQLQKLLVDYERRYLNAPVR